MPEGHTLHRLATALRTAYAGTAPQVTSPQGRFVEGAALLDGREVVDATSAGKHLFVTFDEPGGDPALRPALHVHLGLIGRFDVTPHGGIVPEPVGAVRVRLVNDSHVADLRGATLVALATPAQIEDVLARLGPDPLRASVDPGLANPDRAWERLRRSSRSLAELLMDQSVIAGVGNVFRCEVLFRHRVDPFVPGTKVKRRTWDAIWTDLVELLAIGVAYGQIVTMDDQVEEARETLALGATPQPLERRFMVYKRTGEPCRVCGSRVRTRLVAGRNLFWCGRCQRRH